MHTNLQQRIEQAWAALVKQYNWKPITDSMTIVRQVIVQFAENDSVDDTAIKNRITNTYITHIYDGLRRGEQAAAEELMLACIHCARSNGAAEEKIPDLAAETVRRVIQSLDTVQNPGFLLSFAFKTLRRLLPPSKASVHEVSATDLPPNTFETLASATQVEDLVAQRLLDDQLLALIRHKIPNDTQREVLVRWVFLGDKPHVIAQDLGLPFEQVRLAKSRALGRLRKDEEAMRFFHSLREDLN